VNNMRSMNIGCRPNYSRQALVFQPTGNMQEPVNDQVDPNR